VVGDTIWDLLAALRAGSLGVGLLSGGYGLRIRPTCWRISMSSVSAPPKAALQYEPGDRYNSRVVLTEGFVRPKKRRGRQGDQHLDN
jgi:hypothetical protein